MMISKAKYKKIANYAIKFLSSNIFYIKGYIRKSHKGKWFNVYIPGYPSFISLSYKEIIDKILKFEKLKNNPKWNNIEELCIWYDMNVVE